MITNHRYTIIMNATKTSISRQDTEQNLISVFVQKFSPFWPLLLGLSILGLVLAKVYLLFQTPQYMCNASLIVNDSKKGADQSQLMESFNVFEAKKIVENEIEVLKSKDIIKDVVYALGLYIQICKSEFLGNQIMYKNIPFKIVIQDSTTINSNYKQDLIEFSVDYKKGKIKINKKEYPFNDWIPNPFGGSPIMFVKNVDASYTGYETFKLDLKNPKIVAENILDNLYVNTTSKLASVIALEYIDPIPERGNDILNQLINSYKKADIDNQSSLATNTLNFIDKRINEVEVELQSIEKDLENYRAAEGVINLGEQGNLYLKNIGEYDRRMSEINLQLSVLSKVERYVRDKDRDSGIVPSTLGINDPILEQLLQRLYDAEIQYEELSQTTAENNPILITLRDKIEKIRPSILENVGSQKSNLIASKNSLSQNSGKYSAALTELPGQERIFTEITRKKESVTDLYDFLLQKREEAALSLAPTIGNVRVIEKAEASLSPISPRKSIVYLTGFTIPLLLGFCWVSGKELFSSKVLFRSDLESSSTIPIVGELAFVNQPLNERLISNHKDLFVEDQFRRIISDLQLYEKEKSAKTVLITSSIEGEGKSYVSANIALTLAASGKKTALIDMDLRKASISKVFGLNDTPGISEFIKEKKTSFTGVQKDNGLKVFPAGKRTTDSSNIILNQTWKHFMANLKEEYDVIIIDSPPISQVSDANLMAPHADLSLIVVRHDHTPKFILQNNNELINKKGFEHSGIIFNGIKPRGIIKKRYGNGYGYGYYEAG